ncbi:hypothetical protein L7F22_068597 [Adiantum nelumboides]|nr:hypothetical protein [Adiantum nelumboides]
MTMSLSTRQSVNGDPDTQSHTPSLLRGGRSLKRTSSFSDVRSNAAVVSCRPPAGLMLHRCSSSFTDLAAVCVPSFDKGSSPSALNLDSGSFENFDLPFSLYADFEGSADMP